MCQWPSDPFLFLIFLSLFFLSVLTMMCLDAWIRIIWIVCGLQWYVGWCQFLQGPPKGGRGCLMCPAVWNHGAVLWFHFPVSSLAFLSGIMGLSFDSTFLSPLLLFCLVIFSANGPFSWFRSLENSPTYLSLRVRFCLYGSGWAAMRWQLVGGMCWLLLYGTGICHYAIK